MNTSVSTSCTIPVTSLRTTPYELDWGSSVFAKVVAINLYGDSDTSESANGAVITTSPDPAINLIEDYSARTKSSLGISWSDPVFTGGVEIIDYRISIAE